MTRQSVRAWSLAALIVLLDQASKLWVLEGLGLRRLGAIDVFPPYLTFRMAWNEGVNFGLFDLGPSGRWILTAVALGITAALALWVRRTRGRGAALGAGLVIGGAIGNVIDRLHYGAVADFLNMSCCGIDNPFAFNIADIAIFAGVAVIFIVAQDRTT